MTEKSIVVHSGQSSNIQAETPDFSLEAFKERYLGGQTKWDVGVDGLAVVLGLLGKQIADEMTPEYYLIKERECVLGSIRPENFLNVADLYESRHWNWLNRVYMETHGAIGKGISDLEKDYDLLKDQIESWKNKQEQEEYSQGRLYFCNWDSEIKMRRTILSLLEQRRKLLPDNVSYMDKFECDLGMEKRCESYELDGTEFCFNQCDYNVFHGGNYPKQGPFSDEEGEALAEARCIQEARNWGYPKFNHVRFGKDGSSVLAEKDDRTVILVTNALIRSNLCDDYGIVVYEVDNENNTKEAIAYIKNYHNEKVLSNYLQHPTWLKHFCVEDQYLKKKFKSLEKDPYRTIPLGDRYPHLRRIQPNPSLRKFHILTRCTGVIM